MGEVETYMLCGCNLMYGRTSMCMYLLHYGMGKGIETECVDSETAENREPLWGLYTPRPHLVICVCSKECK